MPRKISPVPNGFRTVTPVLTVAGATSAIKFYAYAFGATQRCRVYAADGVSVAHAELKIGNSLVIVSDELPAQGIYSPTTLGASPVAIHLYFADVDTVWERAIEAGATVIVPLTDTYWGERYGKLVDPYGHIWSIAKRVEALSADEIAVRAAAFAGSLLGEVVDQSPSVPMVEAQEVLTDVTAEAEEVLADVTVEAQEVLANVTVKAEEVITDVTAKAT